MKRLFACIVITLISLWYVAYAVGAPGRDDEYVSVSVREGLGVNEISGILKDAGLIRNSFAFETYVWFRKAESEMKAGSYRISRGSNLFELVRMLRLGGEPEQNRVTLIEGWTIAQYAEYLETQGFDRKSFELLTKNSSFWKSEFPFLETIPSGRTLEGYLYPDTYAITSGKDPEQIIRKMLTNFSLKTAELFEGDISDIENLDDIIILASIVEREVGNPDDRALVADIFLKRLKEGIGLQSDATVNYITGSGRSRSTLEDLTIDSPYNTYKYRGLPPGPIGNPSIESIRAVVNPKKNDYYYFLTDDEGIVHYARTFEEHQANRGLFL